MGGSFTHTQSDSTIDLEDANNWGLVVGFKEAPTTQVELLLSHQSSRLKIPRDDPDKIEFDLDTNYFHLGGTRFWKKENIAPFVSGGLGFTYMRPGLSDLDSEVRLSMSIGTGVKWYPADHFGLRFEFRGYGTLVDGNGSLFCDNGQCSLTIAGDLLTQYEANLGFIIRF